MSPLKFRTFAILLSFLLSGCYASAAVEITPSAISGLLSEQPDKALVIILYQTTCPHCRSELQDLPEIQQHFAERGVEFIGFCTDLYQSTFNQFIAQNDLPFSVPYWLLFETRQELNQGFSEANITLPSSFGVPLLILLDRDHIQQQTLIGHQEPDKLIERIEALL